MSDTLSRTNGTALAPVIPSILVALLEQIGWEIRTVERDVIPGLAVLELHRADGRWLHVATDRLGRASIERWQRETSMSCGNDGRRGAPRDVVNDRFLGRTKTADSAALILAMADYIAANPAPGRAALSSSSTRAAMQLLIGESPPHR